MTSQIKSIDGKYVPFELSDYVDNPVAFARISAGITQEELAKGMNVTQAYISKLEAQSKVAAKVLKKVTAAIETGYLLRSPANAERLRQSIQQAERGAMKARAVKENKPKKK